MPTRTKRRAERKIWYRLGLALPLGLVLCLLASAGRVRAQPRAAAVVRPAVPAPPHKPQATDDPDEDDKPDSIEPVSPDPHSLQAAPLGDRMDVTPTWLFHRGDNPDFASPVYDDRNWLALRTDKFLFTNQFFNLNEIWYRAHVHLQPGSKDLALSVARVGGSYRVFVNGQEIGGKGRMSGRGDSLVAQFAFYRIPDSLLSSGNLVIAMHCMVGTVDRLSFTLQDGISPSSSVYLGPASVLERDQRAFFSDHRVESASVLTLWTVLCALALGLALLIPKVPVYPLLAVYAGAHLVSRLLASYADSHYLPQTHWLTGFTNLAFAAAGICSLEFCRLAAGSRRRVWFTLVEALYLLSIASLYPAAFGLFSFYIYAVLAKVAFGLTVAIDALFILVGVFRRRQDARILGVTSLLYLFYVGYWYLLQWLHPANAILERLADAFVNAFRPVDMGNLAVVTGFLSLVVVRTLRIVRERASIATEIQAARTMQQLLLGSASQPTPGFAVEAVYHPAGEVGGDFFLVTPTPDGALTAIVGDVSGKGLLAAMRVSMILGVLRREPSREPAAMLEGLNEALLTQGELGFTTACCVRLEPSGRYTIANAGHISPYILGVETTTPPALPLGLAGGQTYETVSGTLAAGQRLVLLSDGIPEARSPKGELYGFERLSALTLQPASYIAAVAQNFGQDDDITVVTIACLPAGPVAPPPPGGGATSQPGSFRSAPPPPMPPPVPAQF